MWKAEWWIQRQDHVFEKTLHFTDLAEGNGLSGSIFTKFSTYFGGDDFNAQYVTKGFNEPNAAAKGDMVEKTIQDAIPVQAIWSLTAGNNAADWERAAALYIGAESGDAPYGRANLRAGNFGTTETNGEATANVNIVAAFNGTPSATKRATIEKNLKITYAQATLRYAFFVDNALTASPPNTTGAFEYRAEGDAFYRIIAPFVEEVDAGCDAFISAVLSVDAGTSFPSPEGSFFCKAKLCIPAALSITPEELGTLSGSENSCEGTNNAPFVTPVGSFTVSSNVANEAAVSIASGFITDLVEDSEFAEAQDVYASSSTLNALGLGQGLSGPAFNQARAYFGGAANFNAEYLSTAFTSGTSSAEQRMEMIEKTVSDAIPVQGILSYANAGDWDKAGALYIGNNPAASPYGRANARGNNYGTRTVNGEAKVNENVLQALNSRNYNNLLKGIQTIYTQASLRYAYRMDTSLDVDNSTTAFNGVRTEGQAFYRIIGPMLRDVDSACDSLMRSIYGLGSTTLPSRADGKYYCRALACMPSAFRISSTELGILEGTQGYCAGSAGSGQPGSYLTSPVGNIGPLSSNVVTQADVSATVATMKTSIGNGQYAAAQAAFNGNTYLKVGPFI
eukprot:364630-Chlamydomonas_euryale.AAC.4